MIGRLSLITLGLLVTFGLSCDPGSRDQSNKFRQYYNQGESLYIKHCSNCHQVNGSGLGRLYPPLDKSDFMDKNMDEVICLVRHGRSGPLIVNGIEFNKEMPGVTTLTDLEVAEVVTYIYNAWSEEKKGIIEVQKVSAALGDCEQTR